ncbi:MAG TPA: trypsin-like peptidase domain-containing protein [Ktedonobacterales bacterium]|jgi:S1-C subfamily serine protease
MQGETEKSASETPRESTDDMAMAEESEVGESAASSAEQRQPVPAAAPASAPDVTQQSAAPASGAKRTLRDGRLWGLLGLLLLIMLLLPLLGAAGIGGNSATLTAAQNEMVSLVQKINPSVVQVVSKSALVGATGSGEIFTSDGYIVTNSHVVHGFSDYSVVLADNRTIPARLVADVVQEDLAVLKITADNLTPIAIGDSSKVQVGDFALALGSPLGLQQSATTGIISALNRSGTELTAEGPVTLRGMLQTSAPINPGNSGGALVNAQGELIGIPTLAAVDPTSGAAANGIGFAITSNHAQEVLKHFEQ